MTKNKIRFNYKNDLKANLNPIFTKNPIFSQNSLILYLITEFTK